MTRAALAAVACLLAISVDGAPRPGPIVLRVAPEQPVVAALRSAQAHEIRIQVPARTYVALRVTQLGQNVTLSLPARGARGARFIDGRTTLTGDETLVVVTGDDDTRADHELRVEIRLAWSTPAATARGQYRASVTALRPRRPGDDDRIAASALIERAEAELRAGRADSIAAARVDARDAALRWAPDALADAAQEGRALAVAGRASALSAQPDAVHLLEQAASAAERGGDATGAALATLELASELAGIDHQRAQHLAGAATAAIDALGDDRARADSLDLALDAAVVRSDSRAAETALAGLRALADTIGDPLLAARAVVRDGEVGYEFGEAERARARLEDGIRLLRALGPAAERDLSSALHAMASAVTKFDSAYARSVPIAEEAIALARRSGNRPNEAGSLGQLASALRHLGEHRRAREILERELALQRELRSTMGEAYALGGIGLVRFDLGDRDGAVESLREALTVLARGSYPSYEARTQFFLAHVEQARGNLDAALAAAERAITLTEDVRGGIATSARRASFSASIRRYFEQLIDIELEIADARPGERAARVARALAVSDRAHARVLREELERSGVPPGDDAGRVLDVAALRARLARRGAVAVEYFLGDARSYVFAISATGLTVRRLAARGELEPRVRAAIADLSARGIAQNVVGPGRIAEADARWELASHALGAELLGIAVDALRPGAPIVVVTDGALEGLPFAALIAPGRDERIVERHAVERTPSFALALAPRSARAPRAAPRALVLGDPVFSRDDERAPADALRGHGQPPERALARLPATGVEARSISALAPGPPVTLALGFEASRDRLLSPASAAYDVLHIASHAVVDAAAPERTGLVLSQLDAGGAPRAGFVSLADVDRLALRAELVVLSACESARGRDIPSEGSLSLARGFLHAGAHHVVATALAIPDVATSDLMTRFYRALWVDQLPVAAALRRAQAELAHGSWAAPYYWAAFAVISVSID